LEKKKNYRQYLLVMETRFLSILNLFPIEKNISLRYLILNPPMLAYLILINDALFWKLTQKQSNEINAKILRKNRIK
jgi:hypothetical protein